MDDFPELIRQKINWYRWRWKNNRLLIEYRKRVGMVFVHVGNDGNNKIYYWALHFDAYHMILSDIRLAMTPRRIGRIHNFAKGGGFQALLPKNYFEFIDLR